MIKDIAYLDKKRQNNMNDNSTLPVKIMDIIEELNEQQLRYLNHIIVDRLKLMRRAKAFKALSKFNVGDIVSFENYGEIIKGRIIRINQKTVSIITLDQKSKWNVTPSFLKKEKHEDDFERNDEINTSMSFIDEDEIELPFIKPANNVSRNAPCPCGSGKKYKHCCGK
ncbi:MAG: SEC-C domain-containing protein [Spirochaetes bacterium]|nr:SEC-C domain-containing protein [Spirochaetota bacterium]